MQVVMALDLHRTMDQVAVVEQEQLEALEQAQMVVMEEMV